MDRRLFLASLGALAGCSTRKPVAVARPGGVAPRPVVTFNDGVIRLNPIRAEVDRIFRITVCTRPFRAAGPRLDVEKVGEAVVVHNYGHGGSGWSLSWGSSSVAVEKAQAAAPGVRDLAVVGCGALGLTSAIMAQRAGYRVTIYAKERPPDVRSARATGSWTPDSRVALTNAMGADFPALWERMCRASFKMYESFLGMTGSPIEWTERFNLSDYTREERRALRRQAEAGALDFATFGERVTDLTPRDIELAPGTHPFPVKRVSRTTSLAFNVAGFSRQLLQDFLLEGGRIEHAEFRDPGEISRLPQRLIINATGYGARALWKDETVVPVRGQIAWLLPQPDTQYGFGYNGINVLARRDGIVVQAYRNEMDGYNDASEVPDRAAAETSVRTVAELFSNMTATRS